MDINNYITSGIIEMYVLGLCSPEEKDELELLRSQYPQLNKTILQFEIEFEKNTLQAASETGTVLDNKILQSLAGLQAPVVPFSIKTSPVKKIYWLKPVAVAATALLIFSGIINYNLYKKSQAQQLALTGKLKDSAVSVSLPANDYAVLRNPAITPVAMYGVAPHTVCRCTMYWDKKTGKAYIMIHHLVPSPVDKKYQLWAMVNNKPVNVGMVHDEIRDRFIELENVPEGATAFTVTLENIGGSAVPTADQTFLYGRI